MAHDLFISYSSKDKHIADKVCDALESSGIICWMAPRNITPGKEWGEAIVNAISTSKVMVLLFSSASNNSKQVLREVERAVSKNVTIIPFRIENTLPTKSMEYYLCSTHWLDAFTLSPEEHLADLVEAAGKLLQVTVQAKPARPLLPKIKLNNIMERILFTAIGVIFVLVILILINKELFFNRYIGVENTTWLSRHADQNYIKFVPTPIPGKEPENTKDNNQVADSTPEPRQTELTVGSYLQFGVYNGQPLIWRVVNIDKSGQPLLLTDKIVSVKPFDAPESGIYAKTAAGQSYDQKTSSPEEKREVSGSNNWERSNIREWMNSVAKQVNYSTGPPIPEALYNKNNSYNQEPGFLNGFSKLERNLIKDVSHKAILAEIDNTQSSGGRELYQFVDGKANRSVANSDRAFYKMVVDKVFLLSITELKTYLWDRGWDITTSLTDQAITHDEFGVSKDITKETGGLYLWWLRTPKATSVDEVCAVNYEGNLISDSASNISMGIRPALYLKSVRLNLAGAGSKQQPYLIRQ